MPRKPRRRAKTTAPATKKGRGDPRWDHFAKKAKKEGYAARSVYKLVEIDRRFKLFKPGQRVLDLGCHPGSWLQYTAERIGSGGLAVGVDRAETRPPAKNTRTYQADLTEQFDTDQLGGPFDVVLSDMAPDTTGVRHVDQDRSALLGEIAFDYAQRLGKSGSALVIKIFQGPDFTAFLNRIKQAYARVRCVRPEASRKESIEVYIVALGKK
ncbi:MAG: RlmE family RNA methyltransferase [Alphaproteobacteria bacterium]